MKKKTVRAALAVVLAVLIVNCINMPSIEAKSDDIKTVTISLAGDCSLGKLSVHGYGGSFDQYFDKYGPDYFFKNVKPYFDTDDMTLVNFEGVLTQSNDIVEKAYNIKGRPEFNTILINSGIDAVTLGNNHRMDYGKQGQADTLVALTSINMPYAFDANTGIYQTASGVKIGFVSVNEVYDGKAVETYLLQGINTLKTQKCDLVLACCHWGIELDRYPSDYQKELGHKCIDWGADIVVGCHPHVLQGIEYYNGKYIIYSLGNFCFGGHMNPKDKKSMIVRATFKVAGHKQVGEATLQVIPCLISSQTDKNNYCPTPATGANFAQIIKNLNTYSKGMKITIDKDGHVIHL